MSSISLEQSIRVENVISRYYVTDASKLETTFHDFFQAIAEAGYTQADDFFYSVESDVLQADEMHVRLFLPINEAWQDNMDKSFQFDSFFEINGMIATRVIGEEEEKFALGLIALMDVIDDGDLSIFSPTFYVVREVDGIVYTDLMIGVRDLN